MCFLSIKTGNRFSVKKNICLILCILIYLENVIASEDTLVVVHVVSLHEKELSPILQANLYLFSFLDMEIERLTTTQTCILKILISRTTFIPTEGDN